MSMVLDIQCMPRAERSRTRRLHRAFFDALVERPPIHRVVRDVVADVDELPLIDAWDVEAKFEVTYGEGRLDEALARRWEGVIRLTDELHASDLVVISAPMWNFSVPWYLKRWIDCVVQGHLTFAVAGTRHEGLLAGRPCVVLTTRDGVFRGPGSTPEADFQLPYLRHTLAFMGLSPVHVVAADGMALPTRELSLGAAEAEARSLAITVRQSLGAPAPPRDAQKTTTNVE